VALGVLINPDDSLCWKKKTGTSLDSLLARDERHKNLVQFREIKKLEHEREPQ